MASLRVRPVKNHTYAGKNHRANGPAYEVKSASDLRVMLLTGNVVEAPEASEPGTYLRRDLRAEAETTAPAFKTTRARRGRNQAAAQ